MLIQRFYLCVTCCFLPLAAWAADAQLPQFTDVTEQAGIQFKHSFGDFDLSNIVEGTGVGVLVFDYNGDGWIDLYFPNGCWHKDVNDSRGRVLKGKLTNCLYRNNGNGTFTDVTASAGVGDRSYSCGASAADFDGDGDVDLYVLNYGPNVFYRNDGHGKFTDISKSSGLADPLWSLSAPWFDWDNDGDLDVYVTNYLRYDKGDFRVYYPGANYPGPLSYNGTQDALYRNNGNGTFTNVTEQAGLINPDGRGMSATLSDLNGDGHLDLYVANDAMENFYYQSNGNGTFTEMGLETGLAFGEGGQGVSSMGPAIGDVDRDGRFDVYVPDMGFGCLLINQGQYFIDRTAPSRLAVVCGQYTGWGGILFDYDNDAYLDVFVANGNAHRLYTQEDVLMRNDGTGNFTDVATRSGDYFHQKYVGRGATHLDLDNDGDLDLLVANLNDRPRLLRNDGGNRQRWLKVAPQLSNGRSAAIGAIVTCTTDSVKQIQCLMPVTGYLSQADERLHFGLGSHEKVSELSIRWPNGEQTVLKDVKANQTLTVVQKSPGPTVSRQP